MEPIRGPQYRSALLPWEQELCKTLGISSAEYFEFHELVSRHVKEEQGRDLIPDIRNEPVTIVTLVVGLALSAIGMLLAPKPQAPQQQERGGDFRGADRRARSKYAPLSEFDSVQDLASLGDVIPLVFTNRDSTKKIGGVRVDSQMLWSRMRNRRLYQELYALMLFSAGAVGRRPDFDGFAFGSTKMSAYTKAKLSIWFAQGLSNVYEPFTVGGDQNYEEGTKNVSGQGRKPFDSYWPIDLFRGDSNQTKNQMVFCGVVTPSQSSVFGQYSPIRNGHAWKYAFKYPGKGDGDASRRNLVSWTRQKCVAGYHPGRTNLEITEGSGAGTGQVTYVINYKKSDRVYLADVDDSPIRRTSSHFDSDGNVKIDGYGFYSTETNSFCVNSGGFEEGINGINQSKIDADLALDIGELYLMGEKVYKCIGRRNNNSAVDQGTPFEPEKTGTIEYYFDEDAELSLDLDDSNGVDTRFRRHVLTNGVTRARDESQCPIQKIAVGTIGTTRAVDMVEIGIKSTVFRQINGYPNVNNFSDKDLPDSFAKEGGTFDLGTTTAYYDRVSLFRLEFRQGNGNWRKYNYNGGMFAVHGNNPQPLYNSLRILLPEKDFYEFRFIPFCGNSYMNRGGSRRRSQSPQGWKEYINREEVYLFNSSQSWTAMDTIRGISVAIRGRKVRLDEAFSMSHPYWATSEKDNTSDGNQTNPGSLLNDFWFFDADTSSHANDPEHEITWMNEYVDNDEAWYANPEKQYNELAYAGIICQSATEISSFSNFSAYFKEGIVVRSLLENTPPDQSPFVSTNNFPTIAHALLTNRRFGVGELIGSNSIDVENLQIAAKFCQANGFYWDGVITEKTNLRQFLFEQAAYQLLDFTIIGGRFSLFPSVPYGADFKILNNAEAGSAEFPIKGLFTDGNVRDFKTTFLSPQERQLFTAEVKYREEPEANGFPNQRSMRVRLSAEQGGYFRDPVEVFDLSQFCTSREHALTFAKYALRIRQTVDHAVTFETTPDAAYNLAPGDYIRVAVTVQHQERDKGYTQRLTTGSISEEGVVQSTGSAANNQDVYYWTPGTTEVSEGKLQIDGGRETVLKGVLFTRKRPQNEARVYKIESIAFSEESFVEISATYVPLRRKKILALDWSNDDFVVEDQANE